MKELQRTTLLTLALVALSTVSTTAREATIASPDGKLTVSINDNGGSATYAVALDGTPMVLPSALGFRADFGDFTQGLRIIKTSAETIDKRYEMRQVKQSHFHFTGTQLNIDVENAKQQKMTIQFVVSDNNVAFRYVIPRQKNDDPKSAVIFEEATAFSLPEGTTTFLTPQSKAMVGWERTKPSYEEEYKADAPMTDRSEFGQGYTFPCLFKIQAPFTEGATKASAKTAKEDTSRASWLLISETGVTSSYCGSHLSDYKPIEASPSRAEAILPPVGGAEGGAYTIAYPMPGENNGRGDSFAGITLPGSTPWRTLTVGTSLKPIVETTIQYDVVEPLYESSEDYKSGRYTWSWLIWQDNSINWDDQVRFIDLAAAMNFEYCLVDNWWDQNIGRERMAELSKYALSKGVALMLWYNSNGCENDAPQTPRNCMDSNIARDKEMAWLRKIGVKGIKVDFFGGDKQETMRLYEEILYDANRYGLQCIFHGCTLPRGWERMYPNYVSSEAVLASENVYFTDHHAEQQPFQLCMHPFCRNATGTMDWGGIILNRYMSRDNHSRHQRQTTDVFELASGITNQAAIQCVAMQPNNLDELPDVELEFLRQLPTTWDETRFIDGYPGHYVLLARRHGDQWYIAGLNALKEPLTLTLDLSAFSPKPATALIDIADKQGHIAGIARQPLRIDKRGRTKITMQPNGGIVIF